MKIILTGTDNKDEEEVDVTLEYAGEDSWVFSGRDFDFTISDLTKSLAFLKKEIQ